MDEPIIAPIDVYLQTNCSQGFLDKLRYLFLRHAWVFIPGNKK